MIHQYFHLVIKCTTRANIELRTNINAFFNSLIIKLSLISHFVEILHKSTPRNTYVNCLQNEKINYNLISDCFLLAKPLKLFSY